MQSVLSIDFSIGIYQQGLESGDRGIGGSGDREIGRSGDREIGRSGDREILYEELIIMFNYRDRQDVKDF